MMATHDNDSDCGGAASVGNTSYPSPSLPRQPYRGPLPTFLVKAHSMVDDPITNYIISWSLSGTSFIIHDHNKLAERILPGYFNHNNFQYFIWQLYNYGFSKAGLRRYEYKNQWFQRGKKQLLSNIERPRVIRLKQRFSRNCSIDVETNEINNTQLEILRNQDMVFEEEIQKLKEQQSLVLDKVALLKEQIWVTKDNTMKITTFLSEAFATQQMKEETVCKENGEVAENRRTSDTEYSSGTNQLMEGDVIIPEANASGSYQDNTFWKKCLEIDAQEANEFEQEFVSKQRVLNMELDDMTESKYCPHSRE